jgi:hypothetical protein
MREPSWGNAGDEDAAEDSSGNGCEMRTVGGLRWRSSSQQGVHYFDSTESIHLGRSRLTRSWDGHRFAVVIFPLRPGGLVRRGATSSLMPFFAPGGRCGRFTRPSLLLLVFGLAATRLFGQRQMENLGRGVVAVRSSPTEVFVSWRLLGYEPQDQPFNLYRSANGGPAQKLNPAPLVGGTNFTDTTANPDVPNAYVVRPVVNGTELATSASYTLPANAPVRPYLSLPLRPTPWDAYVHLLWVGDLDGDGEYDFVVSRLPLEADRPQFIDAYKRDGAFLWRVDFGPNSIGSTNIQSTAAVICNGHNDGVTVYDLDSDGRAEVIIKSGRESWLRVLCFLCDLL